MDFIRVAAQNSTDHAKELSDYICNGKNDERVIQDAIADCMEQDKNLYFFNGIYHIDAFYDFGDNGPRTALRFPNGHRELKIIGQNLEYGCQRRYDNGVVFMFRRTRWTALPARNLSM